MDGSGDLSAELLAANARFYAAFSGGDRDAMDDLWARAADVSCDHPGTPTLHGRESVMGSWARILAAGGAPGIHATDAVAEVDGARGVVRCTERIGDAAIAAVNTFVHERGAWRMTGHRAGG